MDDTTGARMHEDTCSPARSNLAVHLAACSSILVNASLHSLYELPYLAPFSDTYSPFADDLITCEHDHALPLSFLPPTSCVPAACTGGVTPVDSFCAASGTQLPTELQQQHIAQDVEAEENVRGGKLAPGDVWLDNATMAAIQGSSSC